MDTALPTRPIRFVHRGRVVEVADAPPTRTVLQWLREDAGCTGTKEGCAEGDCGACTVVLGELDEAGAVQLKPVNACIRFLPTLDGRALYTVEDVAAADGTLHPVQRALVENHGSQCGFCTPGFVMSMWACYQRHGLASGAAASASSVPAVPACASPPSRQDLADALSGNLCRCTGYRPILDAAERMFGYEKVLLDPAPVRAALQSLASDPPLHHGRPGAAYHAPRSVAELAALLAARPQARILAGATDIGLWVNKQFRELPELVWTGEVAELRRIEVLGGGTPAERLRIGAASSLEAAWLALVGRWPSLRDHWLRFASPPVREAGTMGGNVANGSPIGDSAPVLIALGATLVLRRADRVRTLPLEAFYLDYMKNALEPGEFLEAIEVPAPRAGQVVQAYKISKRFDSDISAVSAGFALALDAAGVVREARLVFGGMAAIVKRAGGAEAALTGVRWDASAERAVEAAAAALAADFKPLTDMRASAGYRMQVAQNLLRRLWLQTRTDAPLAESAVSVFARDGRIVATP